MLADKIFLTYHSIQSVQSLKICWRVHALIKNSKKGPWSNSYANCNQNSYHKNSFHSVGRDKKLSAAASNKVQVFKDVKAARKIDENFAIIHIFKKLKSSLITTEPSVFKIFCCMVFWPLKSQYTSVLNVAKKRWTTIWKPQTRAFHDNGLLCTLSEASRSIFFSKTLLKFETFLRFWE